MSIMMYVLDGCNLELAANSDSNIASVRFLGAFFYEKLYRDAGEYDYTRVERRGLYHSRHPAATCTASGPPIRRCFWAHAGTRAQVERVLTPDKKSPPQVASEVASGLQLVQSVRAFARGARLV